MTKWGKIRRFLFGSPIRTEHAHRERLPKFLALPVFASDALSSNAYATEEILRVLVLAVPIAAVGADWNSVDLSIMKRLVPIVIAIAILLIIVVTSYVQTIMAYPKGGGSYIVSSENLGSTYGRTAGGALLIDYILTVAVSISAGVAAIASAFPQLIPYTIEIALFFVALVTWANLRGARESGAVFALPTYSFILGILIVIISAFWKYHIQCAPVATNYTMEPHELLEHTATHPVTLFFILRAFSAGCTALTGVEAISDGVAAFKKPESKNAASTLIIMAIILIFMFISLSWFAFYLKILPIPESSAEYQTVVSQIARQAVGSGWIYYFVQIATMAILVLAANTAYADFPRLSYFMARDNFLPRQLMNVGDRLVFQNGIIILALAASALIIWSRADTHQLIPLYATGVFVSFTLSQAGMVAWQIKHKRKAWHLKAVISAIGSLTTCIVAVIIFLTKFHDGAYLVAIAFAILFTVFTLIHRHYMNTKLELDVNDESYSMQKLPNTVLLLVPRVHAGILKALQYAKSIGLDCRAVHVSIDPDESPKIRSEWDKYGQDVPLVILESPYRSITEPVLDYVDETLSEHKDHLVTVIVPEFVPKKWWHVLLHNNLAFQLRRLLGGRKNVVITNVRYFLDK